MSSDGSAGLFTWANWRCRHCDCAGQDVHVRLMRCWNCGRFVRVMGKYNLVTYRRDGM